MRLEKLLLSALLFVQGLAVSGFAPASKTARFRNPNPPSRICMQTGVEEAEEKSSSKFNKSNEKSNESSLDALKRLLARQEAEIKETKRVLAMHENAENLHQMEDPLDDLQKGDTSFEFMAVAESIKEGFDYGFESRSEGPGFKHLKGGNNEAFEGYGPPSNVADLGGRQFMRNLKAMINEYDDEEDADLTPKQVELRDKLEQLTLNSTAIWERETADGPIEAPYVIKIPYLGLCYMLDVVFEGKYVFSRFFLLETVARMPYFSYITMLHLYETLGFWRRSAHVKRIHFAEELNEYHHLMIMESLGGDQQYWVRFMAQHSAIAYYIGLCLLWALSPSLSYKFSELLETHAVNTYGRFLDENKDILKELPPSLAAVDYYALGSSDPYYNEFQTTAIQHNQEFRRPGLNMKTLFDVFSAIRDDEGDHVSTMEACLDPTVAKLSPSLERRALTAVAAAVAFGVILNAGGDAGIGGNLVDGVDFAAGDAATSGLVDAAIAGAAGIASKLGMDAEEGMLEEGVILSLRQVVSDIILFLSRVF